MTRSGRTAPPRRSEAGVTLVELMISVLLFGILSAGALAILTGQQETSSTQIRASTVLDNARTTLEVLGRQIRVAKGGMPKGQVKVNLASNRPAESGTCGGNRVPVIQVINSSTGPDRLTLVFPNGHAWGALGAALAPGGTSVHMRTASGAKPPIPKGAWVLLTDFDDGVVFESRAVPTGCFVTDWCIPKQAGDYAAPPALSAGDMVLLARWLDYQVTTAAFGSSLPALVVKDLASGQTEPAADGIEDIQIALGIDRDGNGVLAPEQRGMVDGDEWVFNTAGESLGTTGLADACDLEDLLAVRISIVARASRSEPGAMARRPALEDRPAGGPDGYYRVVLHLVAALRN